MIGYLEGKIIKKDTNKILLLTNGIGFEIIISLKTFAGLKEEGDTDNLFIYTLHKDDVFQLYGFKTLDEKEFFLLLISLSGIGPKMAISILSRIDVKSLKEAVIRQDINYLTSLGGIGKKRAEKLLFELKNKIKDIDITSTSPVSNIKQDAILALESLGYSKAEAYDIVKNINISEDMKVEEVIKKALAFIHRKK